MKSAADAMADIERDAPDEPHLANDTVHTITFRNVQVRIVKPMAQAKDLLNAIDGVVAAGQLVALMGPSGSGKTTLLNVLAHRTGSLKGATITGEVMVNRAKVSTKVLQNISAYVEQEDALIGSLTVRETLNFAARLALSGTVTSQERKQRVDHLLSSFGLQDQADSLVGTPIRKGISGGQKRRLSIASQLIIAPKILFLDEPTSGLDSRASYEVISFLKSVVVKHNLLVIASIHQPSTKTFEMFDSILLLSKGRIMYNGPTNNIEPYFSSIENPIPQHVNPAEFLMDLASTDFDHSEGQDALSRLGELHSRWMYSQEAKVIVDKVMPRQNESETLAVEPSKRPSFFRVVLVLLHRSFIKSYRDVIAYGIRLAMYLGLAVMMGTIWLRLPPTQSSIQPFINAIFFGSAFMSFMAVAYVPAFLEDRATFIKERANGLYGAGAFMVSNFLIGIPYLFIISLLFSVVTYFLSNFRHSTSGFFTWVMWLFLNLLCGESLVVLMSSLYPNFVVALALTAFANGLWMSVGGFLVSPNILNVFWKYVFHYIDYQAYAFRGLMVNEFGYRNYDCGPGCQCQFQTELAPKCMIDGKGVLAQYGYKTGNTGKWVGILLGILVGYRVLGWVVTHFRKT